MHAEALRLLEDHCPPGASVLDVGSGDLLLAGPYVTYYPQVNKQQTTRCDHKWTAVLLPCQAYSKPSHAQQRCCTLFTRHKRIQNAVQIPA